MAKESLVAKIRLGQAEDASHLPEIETSAAVAFRGIPGLGWITTDAVMDAETHLHHIAAGTHWVATVDDVLVGFLCGEILDGALHVWELDVDAAHQRRGIGAQLMQAAIAAARRWGLTSVTLTTFRDLAFNEGFYAGLGFRIPDDLPTRLVAVLADEVSQGLPEARRCAMVLALDPAG